MNFYTRSWGIAKNKQLSEFLGWPIKLFKSSSKQFKANDVLIGWGQKENTQITRRIASEQNLPYWALEDGFIASAGHPTFETRRLSIIKDEIGIYYDSRLPSGLDYWLANLDSWFDVELKERIERIRQQLVKLQISKYNQKRTPFPKWLSRLVEQKIKLTLVVDQTFGDCSIEGAQATAQDFERMLHWALSAAQKEAGQVLLKVHPDVILGSKKGYFDVQALPSNVRLVSEDIAPAELIGCCERVVTVSSQLGFEALWQVKEVHCFGVPFYAQRGLTIDHAVHSTLREKLTLSQLMAAALIKYPVYWHPERNRPCEIEDILDWLQAQFLVRQMHTPQLDIVDVSLWKRSFLPEFISDSADKIRFVGSSRGEHTELHWGMKSEGKSDDKPSWKIEDGFIRSVGLGADLRRPSSLVVDDCGIYYNGLQPSRLENILSSVALNDYERLRAHQLIDQLIRLNITKYNAEASNQSELAKLEAQAAGREIVLVTGQFQDDLSIQFGAVDIKTNMSLLQASRSKFPNAFLIYKEHPDVYSGVRPGKLEEAEVHKFADAYITQIPLPELFGIIDRLCTICSLSGFEALLRGVSVNTFGIPFYAGWGLTDDRNSIERRKKKLDITELVYGALVLYPRYVNWYQRLITTPEMVIEQICEQRHNASPLRSSWLHRQGRKLKYLSESLLHQRA